MAVNETLDSIQRRRSVRLFQSRQIEKDDLRMILEAALFAPTAMNQQKWFFSVIRNASLLARMDRITRENKLKSKVPFFVQNAQSRDYHSYYQAPTVILVSGEGQAKFVEIDCGAAAQNVALAAESLGIGSCIMTSSAYLFASHEGRKLEQELGIPAGYQHVCCICLGYKKEETIPAPPRNREVVLYIT